ncbi:MAG: hypothetical protein ACSHWZ_07715 [Sulfitobacter sp.]
MRIAPSHRPLAGIALCLGLLALPAQADLLAWAKDNTATSVNCAPSNAPCLWQAATDMVFANAAGREVASNTAHYARQLADLVAGKSAERQAELRQRIISEASHPSFLINFDHYLEERVAPAPVPLSELEAALISGTAPQGEKFGDYVLRGFRAALDGPNPLEAVALWQAHHEVLWENGARANRQMQLWLARYHPEEFATHLEGHSLSGRAYQATWADLSDAIANRCAADPQTAEPALTATLAALGAYEFEDPVIALYAQAELYPAALKCRGPEGAAAQMAQVDAARPAALAFLAEKYPNAEEFTFVLGAVHDTVALRTSQALATWHYAQGGDPAAARAVFEAGQSLEASWPLAEAAQATAARKALAFEDFERMIPSFYLHSSAPTEALRYFVERYALEETEGSLFNTAKDLARYADQLEQAWPDPLAKQAAAKLITLSQEVAARDPERGYLPDQIVLRLAALPQPQNCMLDEARVQAMLDALPGFTYGDTRVDTLIALLRYLDRAPEASAPCTLEAAL